MSSTLLGSALGHAQVSCCIFLGFCSRQLLYLPNDLKWWWDFLTQVIGNVLTSIPYKVLSFSSVPRLLVILSCNWNLSFWSTTYTRWSRRKACICLLDCMVDQSLSCLVTKQLFWDPQARDKTKCAFLSKCKWAHKPHVPQHFQLFLNKSLSALSDCRIS